MPNANNEIRCIISDGSGGWYVGGYFTQIGGINKNYVAHIKSDKTVDNNFTASCSYAVLAIVKDGSKLYLGGAFTNVNSTPRNYLAEVNASYRRLGNYMGSECQQLCNYVGSKRFGNSCGRIFYIT